MKYVVTAPGRSGTMYTARLLTAAGLRCGHEQVFTGWGPGGRRCPDYSTTEFDGDSSYIAGPFAGQVKNDLTVVQLVRPPLDQIRSVVGLGHVGNLKRPWVKFIDIHAGISKEPPGPRRAAAYYVGWHELIEPHAALRWQLNVGVTAADMIELADLAGLEVGSVEQIWQATASAVGQPVNEGKPVDWVTLDHLGPWADRVVAMADRYGVPLESDPAAMHSGGVIDISNAPTVSEADHVDFPTGPLEVRVVEMKGGWKHIYRGDELVDKVRCSLAEAEEIAQGLA